MLLLPLLLGFLALTIITVRGLFVHERTRLPTFIAAVAAGALFLGLDRFYQGGIEADEQNTSGEPDALATTLMLGGAGTIIALAVRLWYIKHARRVG